MNIIKIIVIVVVFCAAAYGIGLFLAPVLGAVSN